jgi:tRNA (adenine37-N6)-methyltransferase
MEAIGVIKSCYRDKFGTPRQPGLSQSSFAEIILDKKWQPENALQGLEGFSHLWVIFHFHQNKLGRYHAKVHPPRLSGDSIGLFATRSPHRPNPMGLSVVKIEKIENGVITVSGVDFVDNTPVFDLKPYLPEVESIPTAKSGWTMDRQAPKWQVVWTEKQLRFVADWATKTKRPELQKLIEETLCLDPRPLLYRDQNYQETHAVRLYEGDVHFAFLGPDRIEIRKIFSGLAEMGSLE